jgi:hypothetical protein
MTLAASKLKAELQKFGDPDSGAFTGFPMSVADARDRWASAFLAYVQDLEIVTVAVTPKTGSASFGAVKSAFAGPLIFANKMDLAAEAQELANAWAAGVNAIVLASAGHQYSLNPITLIKPFTVQASALQPQLVTLFATPSAQPADRLGAIANAIDTATKSSCSVECTYQVGSSPSTGSISYG